MERKIFITIMIVLVIILVNLPEEKTVKKIIKYVNISTNEEPPFLVGMGKKVLPNHPIVGLIILGIVGLFLLGLFFGTFDNIRYKMFKIIKGRRK